ncbi:MAG: hypothetical protein JNL73_18900 [Anaerolineales bacterium]|nr:hypothetical protein [Anaerolineales bacterium]
MYTICPKRDEHRPDRVVDPAGPVSICPVCGHRQAFVRRPLLAVGGASGSGKSSLCQALLGRVTGGADFVQGQLDFNHWLRTEGPSTAADYRLVDTQAMDVSRATAGVADWIEARLVG